MKRKSLCINLYAVFSLYLNGSVCTRSRARVGMCVRACACAHSWAWVVCLCFGVHLCVSHVDTECVRQECEQKYKNAWTWLINCKWHCMSPVNNTSKCTHLYRKENKDCSASRHRKTNECDQCLQHLVVVLLGLLCACKEICPEDC